MNGIDAPALRSRSAQAVLANLVLANGNEQDREYLALQLWPDSQPDQANGNLRQNLLSLRNVLGEQQHRIRTPDRRRIAFDVSNADIDVLTFDEAARLGDEASWLTAVRSYSGPLLPGLSNEWIGIEREHRRRQFESLLEQLVVKESDEIAEGLAVELMRHDPVNEVAVRRLLAIKAGRKDAIGIRRFYEEYQRTLRRLYGTAPSELTQIARKEAMEKCRASSGRPKRAWIPAFLSEFYGRVDERAQVIAAVQNHRCVVLVGAAGVGKTRLVASAMSVAVNDGIWITGIDPLGSLASRLGVKPEALFEVISDRADVSPQVVVIDGADSSARLLVDLLSPISRLSFIISARESLDIAGAHHVRLGPLIEADAIQLLTRNGGSESTPSRAIHELVAYVGGHPIAIEMLTPLVETTSAESVLSSIKQVGLASFDTTSIVRIALEASWESLTPKQCRLLIDVSLFTGAFDAALVRLIGADDQGLSGLVDKSWLQYNKRAPYAPYRMSPLLREYLQTIEKPDLRSLPAAVSEWIEGQSRELNGPRGEAAAAAIHAARETAEVALAVAFEQNDATSAFKMVAVLWPFWLSVGDIWQTDELVETCLKMSPPSVELHIRVLNGQGFIRRASGSSKAAIEIHRRAIEMSIGIKDKALEAESRERLFLALSQTYDFEHALIEGRKALTLFQEVGDPWWQSCLRAEIATVQLELGDLEGAQRNLEAAEHLVRRVGDRNRLGSTLQCRSKLEVRFGKIDAARQTLNEAAELFSSFGYRRNLLNVFLGMGEIEELHGDFVAAEEQYREMIQLASDLDFEALALNGHIRLGRLLLQLNRDSEAEDEFATTRRLAAHSGQWPHALKAIDGLVECASRENLTERKQQLLTEATAIRSREHLA